MAKGKRSHPTESIGVSETSSSRLPNQRKPMKTMSEVNTIHAFGAQGQETSGWPGRGYGQVGTRLSGTTALYTPPRLSQNELGGSGNPHRRRKHPTQSIGA